MSYSSRYFLYLLAVATAIEQDPIMYSDATLGQERAKYIDWIQKTSSWGGAIGMYQMYQ